MEDQDSKRDKEDGTRSVWIDDRVSMYRIEPMVWDWPWAPGDPQPQCMKPEAVLTVDDGDWLELRRELWPEGKGEEHLEEMARFLAEPDRYAQFVVRGEGARALGFAEASIRSDYVNGTSSSPVAFLEGLYVREESRRRGVAKSLVNAVSEWAVARGCTELASDTSLENAVSHAVHARLGFVEIERVVCFKRELKPSTSD